MTNPIWNNFSAAPHRLFFFSGAIQLILPILFWLIELSGRYTDLISPLETVIPSTWAHGFIMIYGIFIFFIYGFLMTVFPRWMNSQAIEKDLYLASFVWLNAGLFIFEISIFFSRDSLLSGLVIFLLGWLHGIYTLYQSLKNSPAQDKFYERILLSALSAGAIGILSFIWFIYSDQWQYIALSFNAGIWLFLLPVLFSVSHRMLPFFSSNVIDNYSLYQPRLTLWIFIIGCSLHFFLEQKHLSHWLFIVDIPLAITALTHSIRWQLHRSFKNRLLAVLHMAFFWLFIGLSLLSIQSLILFLSGEYILNKAPIHALTIGFISSMLIAMVSRVTMGHSGRPLILDNISWYLFIGIQLAAISRILADIQFDSVIYSNSFNLIAASLWLTSLSAWCLKYAPMYLKKRIDGKPG
jgi:uncharacterized protein involved in response to NO